MRKVLLTMDTALAIISCQQEELSIYSKGNTQDNDRSYQIWYYHLLKQINMKYLKYISYAVTFLVLSFTFSSCSDDTPEDVTYIFGITSATSTSSKEITAITVAYTDAYQKAGVKFNTESFAPGTSKDIILKACVEAEGAIASSSIKFEASYTYEVVEVTASRKVSIYRKVYGVGQ